MVGVVGSSPIAPTKFGRRSKGLAVMPSPFVLAVRKEYGKVVLTRGGRHASGKIAPDSSPAPIVRWLNLTPTRIRRFIAAAHQSPAASSRGSCCPHQLW